MDICLPVEAAVVEVQSHSLMEEMPVALFELKKHFTFAFSFVFHHALAHHASVKPDAALGFGADLPLRNTAVRSRDSTAGLRPAFASS